MTFTAEQRAKALATRMANKAKRDAAKLSKKEQVVEVEAVKMMPIPTPAPWPQPLAEDYDWEEAPLAEAEQKAADMIREAARVQAIIVRRKNPNNKFRWVCWTTEHLDLVPPGLKYNGESVRARCSKGGDGITQLPKFTDNGNSVMEKGVRVFKPAHCCNFLCYQIYQAKRVRQKVEAGI
jgi:hypothetical protein